MYLTLEDFNKSIYPEIRNAISRGDEDYVMTQINVALSIIQSKISLKYDVDLEFAKSGSNRNSLLVTIAKNIAIYHLYETQETIPNHRVKKYDDAMEFLKDIVNGQAVLAGMTLAPVQEDTTIRGNMAFGSEPKRNNRM
jgi:phage gp36-like protein